MKCKRKKVLLAILIVFAVTSQNGVMCAEEKKPPKTGNVQKNLQKRIDFESAYILGQSIKSGAAYLLHRKQSDIKSMLEIRSDYREEILEEFKYKDMVVPRETDAKQKKQNKKEKLTTLPKTSKKKP